LLCFLSNSFLLHHAHCSFFFTLATFHRDPPTRRLRTAKRSSSHRADPRPPHRRAHTAMQIPSVASSPYLRAIHTSVHWTASKVMHHNILPSKCLDPSFHPPSPPLILTSSQFLEEQHTFSCSCVPTTMCSAKTLEQPFRTSMQ
jgi:hypothetical protein